LNGLLLSPNEVIASAGVVVGPGKAGKDSRHTRGVCSGDRAVVWVIWARPAGSRSGRSPAITRGRHRRPGLWSSSTKLKTDLGVPGCGGRTSRARSPKATRSPCCRGRLHVFAPTLGANRWPPAVAAVHQPAARQRGRGVGIGCRRQAQQPRWPVFRGSREIAVVLLENRNDQQRPGRLLDIAS